MPDVQSKTVTTFVFSQSHPRGKTDSHYRGALETHLNLLGISYVYDDNLENLKDTCPRYKLSTELEKWLMKPYRAAFFPGDIDIPNASGLAPDTIRVCLRKNWGRRVGGADGFCTIAEFVNRSHSRDMLARSVLTRLCAGYGLPLPNLSTNLGYPEAYAAIDIREAPGVVVFATFINRSFPASDALVGIRGFGWASSNKLFHRLSDMKLNDLLDGAGWKRHKGEPLPGYWSEKKLARRAMEQMDSLANTKMKNETER